MSVSLLSSHCSTVAALLSHYSTLLFQPAVKNGPTQLYASLLCPAPISQPIHKSKPSINNQTHPYS